MRAMILTSFEPSSPTELAARALADVRGTSVVSLEDLALSSGAVAHTPLAELADHAPPEGCEVVYLVSATPEGLGSMVEAAEQNPSLRSRITRWLLTDPSEEGMVWTFEARCGRADWVVDSRTPSAWSDWARSVHRDLDGVALDDGRAVAEGVQEVSSAQTDELLALSNFGLGPEEPSEPDSSGGASASPPSVPASGQELADDLRDPGWGRRQFPTASGESRNSRTTYIFDADELDVVREATPAPRPRPNSTLLMLPKAPVSEPVSKRSWRTVALAAIVAAGVTLACLLAW